MPTETDIRAALQEFAALAHDRCAGFDRAGHIRVLDTTEQHHVSGSAHADERAHPNDSEVPLQLASSAGSARPSRRIFAMLSTAAVALAVAVALGVGVLTSGSNPSADAGRGAGDAVPRTLAFVVKASAKVTVVSALFDSDGSQGAALYGQRTLFSVDLYKAHDRPSMSLSNAQRVDVNGVTGYFACLGSPDGPKPGAHCRGGRLAWKSPAGRWITVDAPRSRLGQNRKVELLRIARGLDFTHRTRLRSPISLEAAPADTTLYEWGVEYNVQQPQENPPTADKSTWVSDSWSSHVTYRPTAGSDEYVAIDYIHGSLPRNRGRRVTIDGRPAVWSSTNEVDRLWLDAGHGVVLFISIDRPSKLNSLDKVVSFARSIGLASQPDNPKTWFDASFALP